MTIEAAAAAVPSREDFTCDNEVIVRLQSGAKPDAFNRIDARSVFWLQEYLVPFGVRGQVFHADLAQFIAGEQAEGTPVRVVPA